MSVADDVRSECLSLPGATRSVQWEGAQVYKVAGKMFAVHGADAARLTVKCESEDQARMLIEVGAAMRAPHLPRGGWVAFDLAALDPNERQARLAASYRTVRAGLPKRVRDGLG